MFDPEAWRNEALCAKVDPELFFPEPQQTALHARRICQQCPVQFDCLQYALDDNGRLHGVWGGYTVKERELMRRQERRKKPA